MPHNASRRTSFRRRSGGLAMPTGSVNLGARVTADKALQSFAAEFLHRFAVVELVKIGSGSSHPRPPGWLAGWLVGWLAQVWLVRSPYTLLATAAAAPANAQIATGNTKVKWRHADKGGTVITPTEVSVRWVIGLPDLSSNSNVFSFTQRARHFLLNIVCSQPLRRNVALSHSQTVQVLLSSVCVALAAMGIAFTWQLRIVWTIAAIELPSEWTRRSG